MIIFTVTNKITSQVYVGSTRNDLLGQWDKMVAAAEQNLDYPLYREIRMHGRDSFVVEEWDFTDSRHELNQLEREAIKIFNARSLKGYKTSIIKIEPKKKTSVRKSSLEKELAQLFTDFDDSLDEFAELAVPVERSAKKDVSTTEAASIDAEEKLKQEFKPTEVKAIVPKVVTHKTIVAETVAIEVHANEPEPTPLDRCSQLDAIVQMHNIDMSDAITAQLKAIQAAATAVLEGDSSTVEMLAVQPQTPVIESDSTADVFAADVTDAEQPRTSQEITEEVVVEEVDPKVLRIRNAVEAQRRLRAQRNSDTIQSERAVLEALLADLNQ